MAILKNKNLKSKLLFADLFIDDHTTAASKKSIRKYFDTQILP